MKRNITSSTISLCHGVLMVRLRNIEDSIRYYEEHTGKVPSWMISRRDGYRLAIDELENAIRL